MPTNFNSIARSGSVLRPDRDRDSAPAAILSAFGVVCRNREQAFDAARFGRVLHPSSFEYRRIVARNRGNTRIRSRTK
jgi:hypothetical protein